MEIKLIGEAPKRKVFSCPSCGQMIEIWHTSERLVRVYGMVKANENFECSHCGATLSVGNEG